MPFSSYCPLIQASGYYSVGYLSISPLTEHWGDDGCDK